MANISDLPRDLTEEVLSRLPITSVRGAQFTCKKWNALFKDRSFTKKYFVTANKLKNMKEIQVVMMLENRVYLMSVNLCNPSIERISKLISLEDSDRVDISTIFHCGGLMLCIPKDKSRLVVWNPYSGQTRWIEPRNSYHKWDMYALGYEKKINNNKPCRIHKLLRFAHDCYSLSEKDQICEFEIYNLNSDSWKVVDVSPDWTIEFHQRGLTLDENTYWFAQEMIPPYVEREISHLPCFLLCFDFSTERFGPRLPLPFNAFFQDTVTLSSVGENQLAVLFQKCESDGDFVKIWISTKIEPNAVSWSKFLKVDMKPLTGFQFEAGSFFVHKKKKVAVILDKERKNFPNTCNIAYIIGKKGYFKKVYLGETRDPTCWPLVCSYVPSLFKIKKTP